MSSCRIHDAVPRFRDLDENRPGCTCVRSLEKRSIRFAILDQHSRNRSYLSCIVHQSFFSLPFFKFQPIPSSFLLKRKKSLISEFRSAKSFLLPLKISIPQSWSQKNSTSPNRPRFRRTVAPRKEFKNHGVKNGVSVVEAVCVERKHDFTNRRIGRRAFQRPIRACWSVNRRGRPSRASNDPNAGRSCSRTCCSRCTTPPPSIRSRTCNRTSIRPSIAPFQRAITFLLSFLRPVFSIFYIRIFDRARLVR